MSERAEFFDLQRLPQGRRLRGRVEVWSGSFTGLHKERRVHKGAGKKAESGISHGSNKAGTRRRIRVAGMQNTEIWQRT